MRLEHMLAAETTELSDRGFARLAAYITDELGIKMPASKRGMIRSRLLRRVRDLGLASVEEYAKYLFGANGDQEYQYFINAITTNTTEFFREPEHFQYLTEIALPSLHLDCAYLMPCVRVWSAACSTGEEPYTLAMVLEEYAAEHTGFNYAVLGTDVSTRVLAKARRAIYPEEQIGPVALRLRRKYLLRSRGERGALVRMVPALRQRVSFHHLNFVAENYQIQERFEIIFLRNVLIYFDKATQEAVVNKVCRYLQPGGYLFVGHSESLSELNVPVKRMHASIYRKPE